MNDLPRVDQFHDAGYAFGGRVVEEARAQELVAWFDTARAKLADPECLNIKPHLIFPWILDIARQPAILDQVQQILGPDVLLFSSHYWSKRPGTSRYVGWHQDSAFFALRPHDAVTAWVALTPSTAENGCLRVIPGSHREGHRRLDGHFDRNNHVSGQRGVSMVDDNRSVSIELNPGEFSLHHFCLLHGSSPNASAVRRLGLSFFYVAAAVKSQSQLRGAILLRGCDRHGNWDQDPIPEADGDPVTVSHNLAIWKRRLAMPSFGAGKDARGFAPRTPQITSISKLEDRL